MKVNVIFLDYERHQFTTEVRQTNFNNAGYPFDHITIDLKGISAAINKGIQASKGYDAVVTMANDILMPQNWLLNMVTAAKSIPNTGMCGIHCVEGLEPVKVINGQMIHINFTAFGNVLIPMTAINQIGYFNPDYDVYSMNDADYAYRLNNSGYINYYLHGLKSIHLGHDVGQPSDYRRMKDEGLASGPEKYGKWTRHYDETGNYYVPAEGISIIEMNQYYGEK